MNVDGVLLSMMHYLCFPEQRFSRPTGSGKHIRIMMESNLGQTAVKIYSIIGMGHDPG